MRGLVADLKALSPDFRRWWDTPDSAPARRGLGCVQTADSGPLEFHHETLVVDTHRHLRMAVYFVQPAPG
ncbi:hypothetical protein D3C72_1845440 [compost metagenome]